MEGTKLTDRGRQREEHRHLKDKRHMRAWKSKHKTQHKEHEPRVMTQRLQFAVEQKDWTHERSHVLMSPD